ncbi:MULTISPECIES: BTAD domain-containing putative transcriptional regulator [Actinosynnema]|uniref:AfsR/SARP family transcriptional regulator n=1 Tax=Actinosynnema TaxID=40566 RepID=UPI0020A6151D|nr:BTAD domain-containing putative transcriptional regulator [Actinosynnema pretiosum]MCP2097863.1 DNA-binding transcriptional activator of the SARP family [Actinosynnema pretiosum]
MAAKFRVLGPLEVYVSDERIRIGGARQQKLLALLLLKPGWVVPVDRLIDELWSEPPASVRQQVHNAVSALRRSLAAESGDTRLVRTEFGYLLDIPDDAVDTYHFVTAMRDAKQAEKQGNLPKAVKLLQSALAVWRGDAFSGLSGSVIESAAANLHEQRVLCLEELFALHLRVGESASLVGGLTQLVAEHPLRESLRGSLMLALHRSGRQPDALAVYAEGERLFADELGLDLGPRLREVHAKILRGTTDSVAPSVDKVERAADRRVPTRSYLPRDTTSFSGRVAELVELVEVTRNALPTALVISAIDGMGGVGKTALAIHLAHRVAGEYPDGQYFIDLRGFSPGMDPVTPAQALDALLLDSGVPPELVPVDLNRRSALWRSRMAGERALLVLDNAVDAGQVTPLLPGTAGVLVVITSRRKLSALDGAVPLSLDVMTTEDGISLFTTVAGTHRVESEPDAVNTAVELCGRLPLAIRIAAARLRDRSSWAVADLVRRLKTQKQRSLFLQAGGQSVMAVLRVSYRYLAPSQQRLFRLLSLHPGTDFDAYTVAALGGFDVEEAMVALESLFDDNLLRQNVAGRYHFHDLIGDCATQLLAEAAAEQEERAAVYRLLDYYLHVAHTWCRRLDPGIYPHAPQVDYTPGEIREVSSYEEAVDALNAEFANLTAAALLAAQRGWHRHAWQLVCTLHPFLKLRNFGGKAYELYKSAVEAARAAGDEFGESISLHGLAAACKEQRTVTEAIEHLNRALELMRQVGDVDREAHQTVDLGNLTFQTDRLPEARDLYLTADRLLAGSADTRLRSAVVNNLGVLCRDLGEFDQALDHLYRAVEMPGHSLRDELITEGVLGTVLHLRGDHDRALHTLKKVLSEATADRFPHGEVMALQGVSSVYRLLGDLTASVEYGRQALKTAREFGFREFEREALSCLGEAFFLLADLERARQVFVEVGQLGERDQSIRYQARALEGLAHLSLTNDDVAGARQYWERAIDIYPAGLVDIGYARTHLASLDNRRTTCFRCETASTSSAGEPLVVRAIR